MRRRSGAPQSCASTRRASASMKRIPAKQQQPARASQAEAKSKPILKEVWSEIKPTIVGLAASPSAWITKILAAKAIDRILGLVTATITALSGPILRKTQISQARRAAMAADSDESESVKQASGNAASNTSPETRKYARELNFST